MNDDIQYIEQFLRGDDKGFEALVRKYQDRVLTIIYSLIGSDRESEDIAQEVFLKVYHGVRSFGRQAQFSTWLYRIVVNTTNDFLRRRRNTVADDGIFESMATSAAGPRDLAAMKERATILAKALGRVPTVFRTALVLKDIEGLSYHEIAAVLNCSIGTVESKIYRGRQYLKTIFEKIEGGGQ